MEEANYLSKGKEDLKVQVVNLFLALGHNQKNNVKSKSKKRLSY